MNNRSDEETPEERQALESILVELLGSKKPDTVKLARGLFIKYEPAVNFYPHRMTIFRKGEYEEGGPHERRNWPSDQEKQIVLKYFFKAMRRLNRTITGRIPNSEEDSKKQNQGGEWFYGKSWFWSELQQLRLVPDEAVKPSGYQEN